MTRGLGSCMLHPHRAATEKLVLEGGGGMIQVCSECKERILKRTRYYCRYCGIPVLAPNNPEPATMKTHPSHCPRSEEYQLAHPSAS